MISGVIPVDKPSGFTSFDVIAKLRGILEERRLGHSGTLDPMATGVLPVFIGIATKAVDILPDSKKGYTAGFALGFSTDTQDITGEVLIKGEKKASEEEVRKALSGFCGHSLQLPPMYSAIKVGGRRLYELARQGKTVERQPREIEIFDIRLESFDAAAQSGSLSLKCSKGTYVRTLIDDLGKKLGTYAAMTSLRRTYSQGFEISRCVSLDAIQSKKDTGELEDIILAVDSCFECYPKILLSPEQERMYKNGVKLDPKRVGGAPEPGLYRVYGAEFLGLGSVGDLLKPYKNFWGKS